MMEIINISDDNDFIKTIIEYNKTKSAEDLKKAKFYYLSKIVEYAIMIKKEGDYDYNDWKENLGMGFCFFLDEYSDNSLICNFIAKCMLDEIYEENAEFNLNDYLHSKYVSKDTILKIGIKKYILDSVMAYDEVLSVYLHVHIDLIKDIESKINNILNNWDNYPSKEINLEELLEVVHEFITCYDVSEYTTMDLAFYLKYELGIDCLKLYDRCSDDEEFSDEEYYEITFENPSLKEQKILLDFKKTIYDYLKHHQFPDSYIVSEKRKKDKLSLRKKIDK